MSTDIVLDALEEGQLSTSTAVPSTATPSLSTMPVSLNTAASTSSATTAPKKKRKLVDIYDCVEEFTKSKTSKHNEIKRKNEIEMEILGIKKEKREIGCQVQEIQLQQERAKLRQEELKCEQEEVKLQQEKIKLRIEEEKLKMLLQKQNYENV